MRPRWAPGRDGVRHNGRMTSQDSTPAPDELPIRDEMIRLGQALKLGSLVEDGSTARTAVEDGLVQVNGDIETRRGRQLHDGDVILYNGASLVIRTEAAQG